MGSGTRSEPGTGPEPGTGAEPDTGPESAARRSSGPTPDPSPEPEPRAASRRGRALLRSVAALTTEHKLTVAGLVIAAVSAAPVIGGPVAAGWQALFPRDKVALDAQQENDPCFSDWILRAGSTRLEPRLQSGDEREFTRWEREGRILHWESVASEVTIHGTTDEAVQIRDVTFTVTRRSAPASGEKVARQRGCGGGDYNLPDAIAVNLDAMAVGREVSVRTLQQSPRQKEAAKTGAAYGQPMRLPRTLTSDDFYTFYVIGMTEKSDLSWKAEVTWSDGEQTHTSTVDNDGVPFRVSAGPA